MSHRLTNPEEIQHPLTNSEDIEQIWEKHFRHVLVGVMTNTFRHVDINQNV